MSDTNEVKPTKNGLGIAALVIGIIALLFSWIPLINNMAAMLAVLGAIFGIVGLIKIAKVKGKKTFSVIALAINVIAFAAVISSQAALSKAFDEAAEGPKAVQTSSDSKSDKKSEDVAKDLTVGESATLSDGTVLTITNVEHGLTQQFDDDVYLAVTVTVENKGSKKIHCNPYDWKSLNDNGVEQDNEIFGPNDGRLELCDLHPDGKTSGKVYFKDGISKVAYVSGMSDTIKASWKID